MGVRHKGWGVEYSLVVVDLRWCSVAAWFYSSTLVIVLGQSLHRLYGIDC